VVAFSTANLVPHGTEAMVYRMEVLHDHRMDPLYQAAVEATEEAIINSLCAADEMDGIDGRVVPGLPLDDVRRIVERYRAAELAG